MVVRCKKCLRSFDDEYRWTICPHETFEANDGNNNFAHHPESHLSPERRKLTREDWEDCGTPYAGPSFVCKDCGAEESHHQRELDLDCKCGGSFTTKEVK